MQEIENKKMGIIVLYRAKGNRSHLTKGIFRLGRRKSVTRTSDIKLTKN
jgi:hypothetical protein